MLRCVVVVGEDDGVAFGVQGAPRREMWTLVSLSVDAAVLYAYDTTRGVHCAGSTTATHMRTWYSTVDKYSNYIPFFDFTHSCLLCYI